MTVFTACCNTHMSAVKKKQKKGKMDGVMLMKERVPNSYKNFGLLLSY